MPEHVDMNLLSNCMTPSKNVEKDLNSLIEVCMKKSDEVSQNVFESLLNIFIFINREHIADITTVLKKWAAHQSESATLDLDRRVTVENQVTFRELGGEYPFRNLNDIIAQFTGWEC